MKQLFILLALILMVSCSGSTSDNPEPVNTTALERPSPPDEFVGKVNPYSDEETSEGKEMFQKYCKSCHGESGEGNGPTAASLDPKPENLKNNQHLLSDEYLFWRISEGGAMEPFKSSMPPWKAVLTENQIWAIVTYIRTLSQ